MISRNNPRKIILKEFVKANILSRHNFLKKNYPRNYISSIELISPRNELIEKQFIQKNKNSIDTKSSIKKSNISLNNLNESNTSYAKNNLNKTPKKMKKFINLLKIIIVQNKIKSKIIK